MFDYNELMQMAKDASQNALSSAVLISGRICVLITALPLFEEFLNLALMLSGGEV